MSSSSSSTSSPSGSTSNAADRSGRTVTPPFTGQFGSMSPVYNPDGSLKGMYDVQGNFYVRGGSRNSVLGAPTLVNASSSRAPPPPSSMGNMAGGVPMSRSLGSHRGIPIRGILQRQGPPPVYSMPGSSQTTAGGQSQTHAQAMSSLRSVSSMNDMNSSYTAPLQSGSNIADHQMDLHHKEVMMQSQQSAMGRHGGIYLGGASTTPQYPPHIQHAQAVSSNVVSSQTGGPPPGIGPRSVNAAMTYDQILQHQQNMSEYRGQKLSAIGQPIIRDVGSQPTQAAPPQSNPDPYSMLGLLSVINGTNPDVSTLALGMDLTALGLDMTSKEDLFKTFASPWANEPLKADPYDFTLPKCYNEMQRPPLHKGSFRRFVLETLFFIFYSMPQDEAQLYAADELYNRGWFYHKEVKCWFLRIGEPLVKTDEYERGTYECFDPQKFKRVQQANIFIHYENLENRPSLPQNRE